MGTRSLEQQFRKIIVLFLASVWDATVLSILWLSSFGEQRTDIMKNKYNHQDERIFFFFENAVPKKTETQKKKIMPSLERKKHDDEWELFSNNANATHIFLCSHCFCLSKVRNVDCLSGRVLSAIQHDN